MPTTRRRPSALAGAELPHPWRAKVKASAVIVRSAASFIVLPFDGGSDVVAALPVDPSDDSGNDSESGRSRLELKDVVGAISEEHERDAGEPVEPIGRAVLAAIDLLRDGLGVALVGPAVQVAYVPIEQSCCAGVGPQISRAYRKSPLSCMS
ncbi:hypothetical protein [Sinorhizobium medicae]|uniref:hypothetical protein n=1 Tax=Sinorhizobium medicae TaxID=110321 RepID=UPI001F3E041F|nr:hypothetical protein [Sinorhizobium medicae]UWU12487.1 hypothetical protein N2598_30755 [Sinorhizobium medicae]